MASSSRNKNSLQYCAKGKRTQRTGGLKTDHLGLISVLHLYYFPQVSRQLLHAAGTPKLPSYKKELIHTQMVLQLVLFSERFLLLQACGHHHTVSRCSHRIARNKLDDTFIVLLAENICLRRRYDDGVRNNVCKTLAVFRYDNLVSRGEFRDMLKQAAVRTFCGAFGGRAAMTRNNQISRLTGNRGMRVRHRPIIQTYLHLFLQKIPLLVFPKSHGGK